MGKRGPKPRTRETLRLMGSSEQYRRKAEVPLVEGDPVIPKWLPKSARPHWDFWVGHLRNQSVLSPAWYVGLAQYVSAIVEWEELEKQCVKAMADGEVMQETVTGSVVPNPVFALRDKAWERVKKIGTEFGYTPAAKPGVRAEPGLPKNRKGYIKRA